jgi:hypothetical protein
MNVVKFIFALIYFLSAIIVGYAALAAAVIHPGTPMPLLLSLISASSLAMGFLFLAGALNPKKVSR